jgi:hypothetical protein
MDGYTLVLASDVRVDGIGLELYDSDDNMLMDVFEVNDDPVSRVLRVWGKVELPLAVLNWFLAEAERRLRLRPAALPGRIAAADETVRRRWEAQMMSEGVESDEPYNAMSVLARVLCDRSVEPGADLGSVFAAVEGHLGSADAASRKLIIVGLLEDIQSASMNQGQPLEEWVRWLGPTTLVGWRHIERLWAGSISPADFNAFVESRNG